MQKAAYGTWKSPISASTIADGIRISDLCIDGQTIVWSEGRSSKSVLVAGDMSGNAGRVITGDIAVRPRVGYGGGAFDLRGDTVVFFGGKKNRLYRVSLKGGMPQPITPVFGGGAAPQISADGRFVAYVHHDEDNQDRIGVVDIAGNSWPQVLAGGHDFFVQPRFSPCGKYFAYIAWDHPNMPWDGSALYLAEVVVGSAGLPQLHNTKCIAGAEDIAVFQPEFSSDGAKLFYVSDESGFGEIHCHDVDTGKSRQITTSREEHGMPNWVQEMRTYCLAGDQIFCAVSSKGFAKVSAISMETGKAKAVAALSKYTEASQLCSSADGKTVALIGSSAQISTRVIGWQEAEDRELILARSTGEMYPKDLLSTPEAVSWSSDHGDVHGLYYPPTNPQFTSDGAPPLMVLVHGGPTAQSRAAWDYKTQFFTSRGYAVLQVNHRGSTGYGREYMQLLRKNWGKLDVEDSVAGAAYLVSEGKADSKRTVIMGGSAGGYTVLQTMATVPEAFTAGISMYGIADQFSLVQATHKFESFYNDSLLGALPEASDLYRERSPITHARNIKRPLAVFQGAEDGVVPKDQAETIVNALKRNGTPHLYHVYEGEGHGWRQAETIKHFYTEVEKFLRQHVIFI